MDQRDNIFASPTKHVSHAERERLVPAYFVACFVLFSVALLFAMPGLVLLNQQLDWIPTRGRIFEVEVDGKVVPLGTAMWSSLLSGAIPALAGALVGLIGVLNLRFNRKLRKAEHTTSETEIY